jgi:hypothetical protein
MKKVIYLVLLLLPSMLPAQNRGYERLLLPTTPRRYHTQKNYQRLLTIDRDMARRRAFLDMPRSLRYFLLPSTGGLVRMFHSLTAYVSHL